MGIRGKPDTFRIGEKVNLSKSTDSEKVNLSKSTTDSKNLEHPCLVVETVKEVEKPSQRVYEDDTESFGFDKLGFVLFGIFIFILALIVWCALSTWLSKLVGEDNGKILADVITWTLTFIGTMLPLVVHYINDRRKGEWV